MENTFDIVTRIRNGETVTCEKCGVGWYVTAEGYLKTANGYWCNRCGNAIHLTPANVIVE